MSKRETIFFKILLPEKPFMSKDIYEVEVPAALGPYLILPRRAPTLKLVKSGLVRIKETEDSPYEEIFISEGVMKVRENSCTILVNEVIKKEEVNLKLVQESLEEYKSREKTESILDVVDQKHIAFLETIAGHFAK